MPARPSLDASVRAQGGMGSWGCDTAHAIATAPATLPNQVRARLPAAATTPVSVTIQKCGPPLFVVVSRRA